MSQNKTKTDNHEPLLSGTMQERFYKAVHETPPLFYDVVQTGIAGVNLRRVNGLTQSDGSIAYDIVLLHAGNVGDALLTQMLALQDEVAKHKKPHPDNAIDYKSEEEVIAHYAGGGLGFGVFTADGKLIGQAMIACKQAETGPFTTETGAGQANIGWVMIDRAYGGNMLCESLLRLSSELAASAGMSQASASVRVHNEKSLEKFAASGFFVGGAGINDKDGSRHFKMYKPLAVQFAPTEKACLRPRPLSSLADEFELSAFADLIEDEDMAGKWDVGARWFKLHSSGRQKRAARSMNP